MDQRLAGIGSLRNLVSVVREISVDNVRDDALTPPRLVVLAPTAEQAKEIGRELAGPEGDLLVAARDLGDRLEDADRFDVVVVFDPDRTGAVGQVGDRLRSAGRPVPVVRFQGTGPTDPLAVEQARAAIVRQLPDRAPAFGRALPAFRPAAVKAVIDETAMANAQFALVSNIPAVVPIVGSIAAAGADFIVLTKNQLMLIFKLAAIHGRDLHDQAGLIREIVPVVGAGFLWRSAARGLASFIPFAAGTVPKVAIAYAGTAVVGRAADFYYRTERKPSKGQLEGYVRQAADAVKKLPKPGLPDR